MPIVTVVDDDISVRKSLGRLIRSAGLEVRVFATAEQFLNSPQTPKADCLVLDLQLPAMSGIELLRYLNLRKYNIPIIFITAHKSDEAAMSEAASDWTVAYLIKPFNGDELLEAVNTALNWKPSK